MLPPSRSAAGFRGWRGGSVLVTVTPKQKLRFDVVARQFGSPLDGVLTIRKEDGSEQLASGDDRPGSSDPMVDYTVPAGVTKLQISLKDLLGAAAMNMSIASWYATRAGRIFRSRSRPTRSAFRRGDAGHTGPGDADELQRPIELALTGQPSEVSLQGNVIPQRGHNRPFYAVGSRCFAASPAHAIDRSRGGRRSHAGAARRCSAKCRGPSISRECGLIGLGDHTAFAD